jgi:hypothetical protein
VAAGNADGAMVEPGVVTRETLGYNGDDPEGVGLARVFVHAARTTPRRRDAAPRSAFMFRRRCCELGCR